MVTHKWVVGRGLWKLANRDVRVSTGHCHAKYGALSRSAGFVLPLLLLGKCVLVCGLKQAR